MTWASARKLRRPGRPRRSTTAAAAAWHTDSPWDTEIYRGTQLYGIAIPSVGGDTLFASMYEAYDTLPDALKKRLEGLKAEHAYGGRGRRGNDLLDPEDRNRPPAVHPIVRTHEETGRWESLYAGPPIHILRVSSRAWPTPTARR